jgi:hypothetical protein
MADEHIKGLWLDNLTTPGDSTVVGDAEGVFVLHAVTLRNGNVLWFSGHAESRHYLRTCIEWNPLSVDGSDEPKKHDPPGEIDIFCCHFVHLPDGRILVLGGAGPGEYWRVTKTKNPAAETDILAPKWIYPAVQHNGVLVGRDANGQPLGDDPDTPESAHARGIKDILIFDETKNPAFQKVGEMAEGRWYPTPVVMPDGNVLVFSGHTEDFVGERELSAVAETVELIEVDKLDHYAPYYTPKIIRLINKDAAAETANTECRIFPTYPGMHLGPDGHVYHTGTTWRNTFYTIDGTGIPGAVYAFPPIARLNLDIEKSLGFWESFGGNYTPREEGMSILLPPASLGRMLILGGGQMLTHPASPRDAEDANNPAFDTMTNAGWNTAQWATRFGISVTDLRATPSPSIWPPLSSASNPKKASRFDTQIASPGLFLIGSDMNHERINLNLVLLPDSTVFILGGHNHYKWVGQGQLECEIFDPVANTFKLAATMTDPRMYHSTALLLVDGSVIVAGGADGWKRESDSAPRDPTVMPLTGEGIDPETQESLNAKTFQIYQPPYFHYAGVTRPTIVSVSNALGLTNKFSYGDTIYIATPQGENVQKVALMRLGAMTHHTDSEQRYVHVPIDTAANPVVCEIPNDKKVLPPGPYMLWILIAATVEENTVYVPCEEASIITISGAHDGSGKPLGGNDIPFGTLQDDPEVTYGTAGRKYIITRVSGTPIELKIEVTVGGGDFTSVGLTYYVDSKSYGCEKLHGRLFQQVSDLAKFLIDNSII